uniref:Uncharacterized protein n=1 Tax=Cucumis melo TaxID=3656 RepID=A0A9I9ELJ9_CUCME
MCQWVLERFVHHIKEPYKTFQPVQTLLIGATVVSAATIGIPSTLQICILLASLALASVVFAYALFELQNNFVN